MTEYYIGTYQTGLVNSVDAAHELLEAKVESLDSTGNPIVGMGVLLTRRDREQAIGWLVWSGINILCASHLVISDNVALTQDHDLVVADAAHVHAAGAVALTQEHGLVVADGAHADVSANLTVTTNP